MITGIVVALLLAVIVFQYMIIKIDKDKRHEAGHDKLSLITHLRAHET